MRTPLQQLIENWKDCTACELHATRRNVVFCRGDLPADVIFIGEAPGPSEDVIGQPFVGPAGDVLEDLLERAGWRKRYKLAFTNLVMCIPRAPDRTKWHKPDMDHVMACKPRLEYFAASYRPRLFMLLGKEAAEYCDPTWRDAVRLPAGVPAFQLEHPAAVLHSKIANRSLVENRILVGLRDAAAEHLEE